MPHSDSIRFPAFFTALTSAVICVCTCVPAQSQHQQPAPIERRPAPPSAQPHPQPQPATQPRGNNGQKPPAGPHLGGWLESHSNLTPAQQQQALEKGNPASTICLRRPQQRYRDRLSQLNTMPAPQRDKVISRTEWMERLPPEQRTQVRNALQQWGSLPPASHRAVGRTFRIVRGMPPGAAPRLPELPRHPLAVQPAGT